VPPRTRVRARNDLGSGSERSAFVGGDATGRWIGLFVRGWLDLLVSGVRNSRHVHPACALGGCHLRRLGGSRLARRAMHGCGTGRRAGGPIHDGGAESERGFAGQASGAQECRPVLDRYLSRGPDHVPGNRRATGVGRGCGSAQRLFGGGVSWLLHAETPSGNPVVTSIQFVPPNQTPDPVLAYAGVYSAGTTDSAQVEIRFNDKYAAEHPMLFTSILLHEALHHDTMTAPIEESVNTSLDALVSLHQAAHHPGIFALGTELSRRITSRAAQRLNSGVKSRLGLFATNAHHQVFPGSTAAPQRSWWEYAGTRDPSTSPGNPLLASVLHNIHSGAGAPCSGTTFSRQLINCIDSEGNARLTPRELVDAGTALSLRTAIGYSRSVSLSLTNGKVKGKISSNASACVSRVRVWLIKRKRGADTTVSATRSHTNGNYAMTQPKAPGVYYARLKRSVLAGTGVCAEATSKTIRR
jgi:hypothetical protein